MRHGSFMRTRLLADEAGVAAVEFAMIAPAFFALLLSIIDISRYMWELNTIQFAIDEAVRAGVVQEKSNDEIRDLAIDSLKTIDESKVTVAVVSDTDSVTVTANSTYAFMFPISVISSETTISLRAEMPL